MTGIEYATLVISVIESDIRHVHVRVTAALGLAAVFITQLPLADLQALPGFWRVASVVALAMLVLAAVAYFLYTQELNKTRIAIAKAAASTEAETVASGWISSFVDGSRYLWMYIAGQVLLVSGALVIGAVIARLVLG